MSKGLVNFIANLLILAGLLMLLLAYGPLLVDEAMYWLKDQKNQEIVFNREVPNAVYDSVFARLISSQPIKLDPVNTDFALIIEKLGVNVPIVADVSVTDEDEYLRALKDGVAHANVTDYPSEKSGNVYLFAHSALNFWDFGKYAKVFNLLRKLEVGDKIHVVYQGKVYEYSVMSVENYKGWNIYPLTRKTIEPLLTLQTCDPPGTTLNRLIVTSKLVRVTDLEQQEEPVQEETPAKTE